MHATATNPAIAMLLRALHAMAPRATYLSGWRRRNGRLALRLLPTHRSRAYSLAYAYASAAYATATQRGTVPWRCYACGTLAWPVPRPNVSGGSGRYTVGACALAPCGACCKGQHMAGCTL